MHSLKVVLHGYFQLKVIFKRKKLCDGFLKDFADDSMLPIVNPIPLHRNDTDCQNNGGC